MIKVVSKTFCRALGCGGTLRHVEWTVGARTFKAKVCDRCDP